MLSKREKDILKQFVNSNDFLSSKQIADHFDKSVRTIQMDIKNLDVILNNQGARLIHHQRKGYKIEVYNQTKFYSFYQQELLDEEFCGSRLERTIYILNYLLEFDDYVKIDDLADQLFVSKSSLNQNIKEVKNILDKYQITLEHKPYYGIHIVASEEQKRNCIMNELMAINHIFDEDDHRMFDCISDICSSCFVKSQYKIDDVAIMNLLIHVYVNVKRMMKHQHIQFEPDEAFMSLFSHEIVLAREIYDLISKELNIQVNDDEINYLALCIKAKRNYDKQDVITEEMNRLISEMFEYIREKTSMDLSYDIELQVALALHFIPLKIRVEHHMQLKNPMVYDIKQKFTFAYELAILSNMFLNEKYGWLLNENELGYLAVHYNLSLEKQTYYVKAKRVLVVSSSRTSDSLLLKYTLKNWFKDMILEIDVLNLFQLDQQKLQRYDVIFTTIKDQSKLSFPAIQINYFLNEDDYIKIRRALYSNREKNVL
ncbi:MAG: BglG family transcription antiterminator, partial [Traorella sp.]